MRTRQGLALIVVIGILGVLAVIAVAFVAMAQLERRASGQRVNAARAYLLARSGIEDALARLALGQDAAYGGENWDGSPDGLLSDYEADQEVYRRTGMGTPADVEACPARQAMRPSFFVRAGGKPAVARVEGRFRGYSGFLAGDHAERGNAYALKVSSSNAGIFINGGALDGQDRDPDGPGADASAFLLNPGAAVEVAPLLPNKVPDYRDTSMEGPNGFLVRLLNNLDAVVMHTPLDQVQKLLGGGQVPLGEAIVGNRPLGGYKSLEELKPVLGQSRLDQFKPYLTIHAWVDPKVVKPQPLDGRPARWEDIDDAHRIGTEAKEISGVKHNPAAVRFDGAATPDVPPPSDPAHPEPWLVSIGLAAAAKGNAAFSGEGDPYLSLNAGILGNGRETNPLTGDLPWTQTITAINAQEGVKIYPVSWERGYVYAWSQLRLSPPAPEPRAPVAVNDAPAEVLAAVLLGLKGAYLETWDGSAGWDGGFGWFLGTFGYPYPSPATEETPWHRTRLDYGMTYGASTGTPPSRPWYGPASYQAHPSAPTSTLSGTALAWGGSTSDNRWGTSVIQPAPLGRLRETPPLTPVQARSTAGQILQRRAQAGPFRTRAQFNAFLDRLPRWEDVNDDGLLDGPPYPVLGSGGAYTRQAYGREDLDSDGVMTREAFVASPSTSWRDGTIAWLDPRLPRTALAAAGQVPGITFLQKDVLKAMANPNTDLHSLNPDANLFKEVDKAGLCGISAAPGSYAHTTELSLDGGTGYATLRAVGRILGSGGHSLAARALGVCAETLRVHRDTTQADFLGGRAPGKAFSWPGGPYPLAGGQPLVSYPEPPSIPEAAYDGQVGLGFIGAAPGPLEVLRGDLFDTVDAATGQRASPDLRGPFLGSLLRPAGGSAGNVFPDGVYSERDRTLRFAVHDVWNVSGNYTGGLYIAFWAKPGWLPEATPRAHALIGLGGSRDPFGASIAPGYVPLGRIPADPVGLYFVPARNNASQDAMGVYVHAALTTQGGVWPRRALLWGTYHCLFASDCLNRRGILEVPPGTHPMGRLEGHRWQHVAAIAWAPSPGNSWAGRLVLGRKEASFDGGGWNTNVSTTFTKPLPATHGDGTPNHLRFGEMAGGNNMNYAADATFASIRGGAKPQAGYSKADPVYLAQTQAYFTGSASPAALGRYVKEDGAAFASAPLPATPRAGRVTWTEIPCDLWFDEHVDGWLGDPDATLISDDSVGFEGVAVAGHVGLHLNSPTGRYAPLNDRDGNGQRDVRIEMEVWDDRSSDDPSDDVRLTRFDDPAAPNRIPRPQGRLYYKAIFVNEWDPATRANYPLDVTPFLDDVTITVTEAGGPRLLAWGCDEE